MELLFSRFLILSAIALGKFESPAYGSNAINSIKMSSNSKPRVYEKQRKHGKRNEARNEEMKALSFGKLSKPHAFLHIFCKDYPA